MTSISNIWKQLTSILSNLNYFQSLEVVDRVSETQLQVGENSGWIIWRLNGYATADIGTTRADGRKESYRQTKKIHDDVDETVVGQEVWVWKFWPFTDKTPYIADPKGYTNFTRITLDIQERSADIPDCYIQMTTMFINFAVQYNTVLTDTC